MNKLSSLILMLLFLTGCSVSHAGNGESTLATIINFFTSRIINYMILFLGLVLFLFVIGSVKENLTVSLICLTGAFTMLTSAIFYWRMGILMEGFPEKEIFTEALDIGLAHAVVSTVTLLFLSNALYLVIFIVGRTVANLIDICFRFIGRIFKKDSTNASASVRSCLGSLLVVFLLGAIPFGYYLLLIATQDLQIFLFGNQDSSLGWNYPTSFTFRILIDQLQLQAEAIKNDPLLGLFIIPLGIFIGIIIKVGGVLDAVKKIRGFFGKQQASGQ